MQQPEELLSSFVGKVKEILFFPKREQSKKKPKGENENNATTWILPFNMHHKKVKNIKISKIGIHYAAILLGPTLPSTLLIVYTKVAPTVTKTKTVEANVHFRQRFFRCAEMNMQTITPVNINT